LEKEVLKGGYLAATRGCTRTREGDHWGWEVISRENLTGARLTTLKGGHIAGRKLTGGLRRKSDIVRKKGGGGWHPEKEEGTRKFGYWLAWGA